jgi:hypothetical protein
LSLVFIAQIYVSVALLAADIRAAPGAWKLLLYLLLFLLVFLMRLLLQLLLQMLLQMLPLLAFVVLFLLAGFSSVAAAIVADAASLAAPASANG